MAFSIAIAGKGGIGKTTLSALLVRALKEAGKQPILAVDADPNSNLAEALGVEAGRPLAEIREQGSSPEGSPSSGIGRVRAVEDEIQRAITEAEGFDLITMGRPEGPRCYCAVNNLLRKSLDDLSRNYAAVVVDNEAGMEHLSRRTTNDVDVLVVVMNPTLPSIRAAQRILELSRQLPVRIAQRVVLLNRVGTNGAAESVDRQLAGLHAERLPDVPQDDDVESGGAVGQNVFRLRENSPALVAVHSVVQILTAAPKPASQCPDNRV
jgi:CO dehydrogenase maturation factor